MSYRGDRGRSRGRGGGSSSRGRGSSSRGSSPYRGGGPREPAGIFMEGRPATVDTRLVPKDMDNLLASFRRLSVNDDQLPTRPDWGTDGRITRFRANFFPVTYPKGPIYEYDVKINPDLKTKRRLRKRVFDLLEELSAFAPFKGSVAHDYGAKIYTIRRLPEPLTFKVPYYHEDEKGPSDKSKEYTIQIVYIQEIDLLPLQRYIEGDTRARNVEILPAITALNVILSQHPSHSGVSVGRNRFFFPQETFLLGGGLEAWRGFYSSVRPTYKQLMVNVNVATTAFYNPGNLAVKMLEWKKFTRSSSFNIFLKGLRVKTTHLHHSKSIKRAGTKTARQYRFRWEERGRDISVEEYFRIQYGITLQHANDLPLVDVGNQKSNFMPAELCEVLPGQSFKGKLTDEHTATMITHACKPPNFNANNIVTRGLTNLGFTDTKPPLGNFGIRVGTEMSVVPGRILPTPKVMYSQRSQDVDGPKGAWNLKNVRFSAGANLRDWGVLVIKDGGREDFQSANDPALKKAVGDFIQLCKKSGIKVETQPVFVVAELRGQNRDNQTRSGALEDIRAAITSLRQPLKTKPSLLFVTLSSGDKNIYSGIKHLCDVKLDVHTVCVQASKFRRERGQLQYFANVSLKFNMKLGGVNHTLDNEAIKWLLEEPTMLVGMDVTHPGPGSLRGTPSIAAVVASVDHLYGQFPCSLRIQQSKKEMIEDLKEMMKERLEAFKATSKRLPQRILVYRDGVSDGQYKQVVDIEMPQMRNAFKLFDTRQGPYQPQLTIVICGKRHHTRFYPIDSSSADDKGNPLPGTVIDRGVTAIYEFDFFLQAHGGLQGTTRPTHYFVVHDEIRFSADVLQKLTNDLSYLFARATRAVSLVSPAYYADLACERGRCYLRELLQSVDASTTASGAEDEVYQQAKRLWGNGIGPIISNSMFYL